MGSRRVKVLVVDDEQEFALTLVERLIIRDFDATAVKSGKEALSVVRSANSSPDVVVQDLKMPDMSGLDVLAQIKDYDSSIEVIMLTGHGNVANKTDGIRGGAFDYIMKPVDINDLIIKIVKASERRHKGLKK